MVCLTGCSAIEPYSLPDRRLTEPAYAPDDASSDYDFFSIPYPPPKAPHLFGRSPCAARPECGHSLTSASYTGPSTSQQVCADTVEEDVPRALRKELLRTRYAFVLKDSNHNAAVLSLGVSCPTLVFLATLAHGTRGQHVCKWDITLLQQDVRDIVGAVFA